MSIFNFKKLSLVPFLHTKLTMQKLNKYVKEKASIDVLENFSPLKENFLYVAASCLPYHISGYTTRTHEVLKSVFNAPYYFENASKEIIKSDSECCSTKKFASLDKTTIDQSAKITKANLFVLTRAGYPWDRKDSLTLPEDNVDFNILDNIKYEHIKFPKNNKLVALYAKEASLKFENYIVKNKISCVHAASNHANALPALIAAKRLGIEFQYEMRGLWELTRISRQPEFEKSHNFKLGLSLEAFVAKHADKVFVISNQLSLYIQKNWKISKDKIFLLPNCADTDRIKPEIADLSEGKDISDDKTLIDSSNLADHLKEEDKDNDKHKIIIGYAGSLIVYEGLQTLLKAMDILVHKNKVNIHLNIIGEGEYRKTLEELASSLKLSRHVTFFGRLSPSEAKSRQDECSLICIPREPFEVCKIVPPIKLVEAMAKGKCVVVPNLPVFVDELTLSDEQYNSQIKKYEASDKVVSSSIETLSNNESGCIFFKAGDPDNLAEVLQAHLNCDELISRGIKARKYVEHYREWKMFAPNIVPIYRDMQ